MRDDLQLLSGRFEDDRTTYRWREALLASVILHLLLVIFVLVSPKLFPSMTLKGTPRRDQDSRELGFLAMPRDYQKLLQKPKPPILPAKDRIVRPKPPKVDSKSLRPPETETKAQLPKQAAPAEPPKLPLPQSLAQPAQQTQAPPIDENKQIAKLQMPSTPSGPAAQPKRSLRDMVEGLETPGFSIQSSIDKARQSGNYGSGGTGGDPIKNLDNRQGNFSVEEPTVLSDTHGVDFSGWLRLIYFRVRDNWYSVIPEFIRSGTKGKVVIIFDLHNNGRIDNLQVVRSSGLSAYDRAAVSSLKLSEPFPSFPPAFKGELITLQFSYLYNMRL